jgi:hypothetical protein
MVRIKQQKLTAFSVKTRNLVVSVFLHGVEAAGKYIVGTQTGMAEGH